jgi:hypothetical protein
MVLQYLRNLFSALFNASIAVTIIRFDFGGVRRTHRPVIESLAGYGDNGCNYGNREPVESTVRQPVERLPNGDTGANVIGRSFVGLARVASKIRVAKINRIRGSHAVFQRKVSQSGSRRLRRFAQRR